MTPYLHAAASPEGDWLPYEVDKLRDVGLAPVQLGERILRVETAVTALLARLFYEPLARYQDTSAAQTRPKA